MGFIHIQNSNLDDRDVVADLLAIANAGPSGRRIVNCGGNTLNTPYKAGLTTLQSGTAVVCMSSANYGTILYVVAGTDAVFLRPKVNGTWKDWERLLSNANFIKKMVSLNQVTVPANAGIIGSTTNISNQIPSGYKLLDARELGSGNNGCYIYYFKVDGTNITLQLRNVTNDAITTSPGAQLLLIPE